MKKLLLQNNFCVFPPRGYHHGSLWSASSTATMHKKQKIANNFPYTSGFKPAAYHHYQFTFGSGSSPSTEFVGFRMTIFSIQLAISFVNMHFLSPVHFFFHFILCFFIPCVVWSSSSSATLHFKFQSVYFNIFIFLPQNMTYHQIVVNLTILSKPFSSSNMSINSLVLIFNSY